MEADEILPSRTGDSSGRSWTSCHHRLHRHLRRRPVLLPAGAPLLLAVSGGQDSMALATLLQDLRPLHGWRLLLWHGDHGWRPESSRQAEELAAWARARGLPLVRDRAVEAPEGVPPSEAAARRWRYGCLERLAVAAGCSHVVTGHTASDRAETLLLHLARGCHRRGLGSLRECRPLREGSVGDPTVAPLLVRPLLLLSRAETGALCGERGIPVWVDASNTDPRFRRNRVRAEVLPVLEAIHPGAERRISALAERLAAEEEPLEDLTGLALRALACDGDGLSRRELMALAEASRRRLLQAWVRRRCGRALPADRLEDLLERLTPSRGNGCHHLPAGWRLRWDRRTLWLDPPEQVHG